MPIDLSPSTVTAYDHAVLRSAYRAFASQGSEWGDGAQAGMRAAASILGITLDDEEEQA